MTMFYDKLANLYSGLRSSNFICVFG